MLGIEHSRFWRVAAAAAGLGLCIVSGPAALSGNQAPTLEQLKERVAKANVTERPALCVQISELELGEAERFYGMGDSAQAKGALDEIVAYSGMARDSAIQAHKHEKQSEIAIRKLARKLVDLKHTLAHEDQGQVQDTVDQLQRIRDDLLTAMFPKGR